MFSTLESKCISNKPSFFFFFTFGLIRGFVFPSTACFCCALWKRDLNADNGSGGLCAAFTDPYNRKARDPSSTTCARGETGIRQSQISVCTPPPCPVAATLPLGVTKQTPWWSVCFILWGFAVKITQPRIDALIFKNAQHFFFFFLSIYLAPQSFCWSWGFWKGGWGAEI